MWPNPRETAYLVTFTEEILNRKLHFLCNSIYVGRLSFSISPDYFLLLFNRMTKQNDVFASFETSLTMSTEVSYNWIFSVLNTSDTITSSFYARYIYRQKFVFFGYLYFIEGGCKIFLQYNLIPWVSSFPSRICTKKIIKKHKVEQYGEEMWINERLMRFRCNIMCKHCFNDWSKLLLFQITSSWNHEILMFLL